MALNLWKLAGKPTSYNPLPSGFGNNIPLQNIGGFTITFRAKSASNAQLEVFSSTNPRVIDNYINLTPNFQTFTYSFLTKSPDYISLYDYQNKGDIIIDSITLVQNPLPKLTINGVSNNSSDWEQGTIGANGTLDDTGYYYPIRVRTKDFIPLLPNTIYTINANSGYEITYNLYDSNKNGVFQNPWVTKPYTFTTGSNIAFIKVVIKKTDSSNISPSDVLNTNLMLNLGSIPAPYSKKIGDRMVMPTPKKNLISAIEQGAILGTGFGNNDGITTRVRSKNVIIIDQSKNYTISCIEPNKQVIVWTQLLDGSYSQVQGAYANLPFTFSGNGIKAIRLQFRKSDDSAFIPSEITAQLEQGTVATSYTPYAVQVNKKPQRTNANGQPTTIKRATGLRFNGVTDYIAYNNINLSLYKQVIYNISFKLNSYPIGGSNYGELISKELVIKFRITSTGAVFILLSEDGTSWTYSYQTPFTCSIGVVYNLQLVVDLNTKTINLYSSGNLVSSLNIPSTQIGNNNNSVAVAAMSGGGGECLSGVVYSYSILGDGNKIIDVDLTNPKNIVGNTVIPNTQNLIPSFEDARWSINGNAKVLGKDVLHLDATASFQASLFVIPVKLNDKFVFSGVINGRLSLQELDVNKNLLQSDYLTTVNTNESRSRYVNTIITITNPNVTYLNVGLSNYGAGSFDFIKPQLYKLSGQEGTIYGAPIPLNKPSKRSKYALR
jgi:hypothetical protein